VKDGDLIVRTETKSGPPSLQSKSIRRMAELVSGLACMCEGSTVQINAFRPTNHNNLNQKYSSKCYPVSLDTGCFSNESKFGDTAEEYHYNKQPGFHIESLSDHGPQTNTSCRHTEPLCKNGRPNALQPGGLVEPSPYRGTE